MSTGDDRRPDPTGRYSRQALFRGIGAEGQAKLMAARAAVIGCGALGAMQASLLVRAGVGRVRLVDRDFVEESNLQRQILFDEEDVRAIRPKAVAAAARLRTANSTVVVEGVVEDVNPATIHRLLEDVDLVLDATDNFDARFLINDYAVKYGKPWIYGGCVGSYGLTFAIVPGLTACLRCIFENAPPVGTSPTCDTEGIIGPIAAVIGSLQVAEALKILCGKFDRLDRGIRRIDLWTNRYDRTPVPGPARGCVCCGAGSYPYLDGEMGADATALCGRNSVQILRREGASVDLDVLAARLRPAGRVERTPFLLRASFDNCALTVFPDGRAIVSGTQDRAVARSLYARYVGA